MKHYLLILTIVLTALVSTAQRTEENSFLHQKSASIEFIVIPTFIFNHIDIGIGIRPKPRVEHLFNASTTAQLSWFPTWNLTAAYSFNHYLKNEKTYFPFWLKATNIRREVGYEEGYFPHRLRVSAGSGIGRQFYFNEKWFLRLAFDLGAGLQLTNTKGKTFEFQPNFNEYSIDNNYPVQNPPWIITSRILLRFGRKTWGDYR